MIKLFFWFFLIIGGLVSLLFIYKGIIKIREEGTKFKWQQLIRNTPFKESSGVTLLIEGIFGLCLGASLLYVLLNYPK